MRTVPYSPRAGGSLRRRRDDDDVEFLDLSSVGGVSSLHSGATGGGSLRSWRYYDEHGHGPFGRFLRPDNPSALTPTRRILMFLFLGSCLSTVGVQFTADEYYEGPQQTFPYHLLSDGADKTWFPVHIAFKDVGCSVGGDVGKILSNMTGEIRPGKVTGIMGQSGSGKTTFAYSLLGRGKRYCTGGASGSVYLNGRPRDLESFLDRVGFVPQDDVLYPGLTVEEALWFSASWRLPRDFSTAEKQKVVEDTLETLDLQKVRHSRIGDAWSRGISGGERKRTSIGMELVAQPSVLVMDEPTSGLDSTGTWRLMRMLRRVAQKGVSVVTVIHQPSERVFKQLDDLILMQNGEAAYVGSREGVVDFFFENGYLYRDGIPAAEFILDVVARLEMPSWPTGHLGEMCFEANFGVNQVVGAAVVESQGSDEKVRYKLEASECMSKADNQTHPFLPTLFRHTRQRDSWSLIEAKMQTKRDEEDLNQCVEQKWKRRPKTYDLTEVGKQWRAECLEERDLLQRSHTNAGEDWLTRVSKALFGKRVDFVEHFDALPSYQQLPKAGLKRQVHLWFWQTMGLKWRRGLFLEIFVIASLAQVVGFVRSFNNTWNRRAVSNLFLSISIGLLGMVGAVFNDEIGPVQRAASAGMLLGAHEFSVLAESIVWGWCVCHVYTINYFTVLWARTGVWIIDMPCVKKNPPKNRLDPTNWVRLQKYYEFAHMLHLNYLASGSLGNAICVLSNHDTSLSYIASVAVLIACHVFAFFTPNHKQIKTDSKLFGGKIDIGPMVETICSCSYVRYFLEAIFLWDPSQQDVNGRNYVLRYFGYNEANKTHCATSLFSLWTCAQAVRFLIFGFRNSNDFHSLYDTPLFLTFIFKVLSCHVVALILMTIIQEWYFPWVASLQEKVKNSGRENHQVEIFD